MTVPDRPDQVGRRVVVRYRRPAGSQPPLTDVVGVVTAIDGDGLTVEAPAGPVHVRRADIVVVKAVPPAPVRRGRPHTAVSTVDLERLMADGWRAVEEEWLGDWVLRASSGFTGRGNSVLPLGDPGLSLESAVGHVEEWYAARGLPSQFHLDLPASGVPPPTTRSGCCSSTAGYRRGHPDLVMTGASSDIDRLPDGAAPVHVSASLEPSWLAAYEKQRSTLPGRHRAAADRVTGPAVPVHAGPVRRRDRRGTDVGASRLGGPPGALGPDPSCGAAASAAPSSTPRASSRGSAGSRRSSCRWRRRTTRRSGSTSRRASAPTTSTPTCAAPAEPEGRVQFAWFGLVQTTRSSGWYLVAYSSRRTSAPFCLMIRVTVTSKPGTISG